MTGLGSFLAWPRLFGVRFILQFTDRLRLYSLWWFVDYLILLTGRWRQIDRLNCICEEGFQVSRICWILTLVNVTLTMLTYILMDLTLVNLTRLNMALTYMIAMFIWLCGATIPSVSTSLTDWNCKNTGIEYNIKNTNSKLLYIKVQVNFDNLFVRSISVLTKHHNVMTILNVFHFSQGPYGYYYPDNY